MISIALKRYVAATPSQVITILLEHEQLNRFFNANFKLVKAQNIGEIKGGKGAVRQVNMMGVKFEERIISANNQHIHYQIIGNQPVANHRGDIHVCHVNDLTTPMTEVTYKISCKSPWWLPNHLLKFFIEKDIKQALNKITRHFREDVL